MKNRKMKSFVGLFLVFAALAWAIGYGVDHKLKATCGLTVHDPDAPEEGQSKFPPQKLDDRAFYPA